MRQSSGFDGDFVDRARVGVMSSTGNRLSYTKFDPKIQAIKPTVHTALTGC